MTRPEKCAIVRSRQMLWLPKIAIFAFAQQRKFKKKAASDLPIDAHTTNFLPCFDDWGNFECATKMPPCRSSEKFYLRRITTHGYYDALARQLMLMLYAQEMPRGLSPSATSASAQNAMASSIRLPASFSRDFRRRRSLLQLPAHFRRKISPRLAGATYEALIRSNLLCRAML